MGRSVEWTYLDVYAVCQHLFRRNRVDPQKGAIYMGEESPEYFVGHHLESNAYQTVTAIDDKIYAIGGSEDKSNLSIGVKVFDKLTGTWLDPTVFGTKPTLSNGHAVVALNNGRLLILKTESSPDDCIWFLEVDTPFVKEKKKLLGADVVAWSKGVIGDLPKPIVISGPSGVGKGATFVRTSALEAVFIFICPPSDEELEKRLRARGTECEDQVQKRLRNAKIELERGKSPGLFDHILVNDDLEACYQNLKITELILHHTVMENFKIPISHSLSKVDDKISITFPSGMFMLDVSSLKGGAPGRTRGLTIDSQVTAAAD
ncbi:hypothetical protein KSP40_PGU014275 [Platanthera guangdongensis]|uniref:Guanylate kinase-like domain-containing protein n=1 Tax=Platanthera guangdongensis TaxID=2320717 RepID=A0ABR2MGR3_9ASPA